MKRFGAFVVLIILTGLMGCKKNPDPVTSRSELLVSNKWIVQQITDTQGKVISKDKMGLQTLVLFELEFNFKSNNQVTASDKLTKQIINGGTWQLVDNENSIDVNISQLKDRFGLVEISRSKMVLRKKVPVNGTDTDANLEFAPSL